MPVILATQEAETRRIEVRSQPGQIVPRDPISKKPITKIGPPKWQVAQGECPEFKPQYHKKKKKKRFQSLRGWGCGPV
jgi:hypothetical protein